MWVVSFFFLTPRNIGYIVQGYRGTLSTLVRVRHDASRSTGDGVAAPDCRLVLAVFPSFYFHYSLQSRLTVSRWFSLTDHYPLLLDREQTVSPCTNTHLHAFASQRSTTVGPGPKPSLDPTDLLSYRVNLRGYPHKNGQFQDFSS